MRFLTGLSFALILIFSALILLGQLIGHLRPTMLLASIMSYPDGSSCDQPCIFGVIPGVTTAEQARKILDTHPLSQGGIWLDDRTLMITNAHSYIALGIKDDNRVEGIMLTDSPGGAGMQMPRALIDQAQLGEVLLKFGTPTVGLPGSNYFVVDFPHAAVIATSARPENTNAFIEPTSPISSITLSDLSCCTNPLEIQLRTWIGFKRMQQYFNEPETAKGIFQKSKIEYNPPYRHCPR